MYPTPSELEFFAGQEDIEILPRFDSPMMWLISGDLGPFKAGIPIKVPLWIALHFRAQNKCKIIAPLWMSKGYLEELKEVEGKSPLFTKMPSEHYMAVAKMVFDVCPQDIPDADCVKLLFKVSGEEFTKKLVKRRTSHLSSVDENIDGFLGYLGLSHVKVEDCRASLY